MSPSPAPTKRAHWPALDGWRGFTIWFAISVHAGYFTAGGVLSLDTFFVLSGFLITGLLIREWDRSAGIDLLAFWARRARRLLPALFVVLGAVLVYAAVLAPSLGLDTLRADVLASLGYVVNWHFILSGQSYFGAFTTPSPVLHLWSLAVEEQFYLIWPPVVLGTLWLARRRLQPRAAIATVGVLALGGAIASSIWMVALYTPGGDPSRVYYGTDTRAQAMLIGAALAVVSTLHGPLRSRTGRGSSRRCGAALSVGRRRAVVRVGRHRGARRLLRPVRPVPLLRRHRHRALAPHPTTCRCAWRRAVVGTRALGRRDLVRDVPLALAHLSRGDPGSDRSRGAPAARGSSLRRGRAGVGHRATGRRPDPPRRAPAFTTPGAGDGRRHRHRPRCRGVGGDDRRATLRSAGRPGRLPTAARPRRPEHRTC